MDDKQYEEKERELLMKLRMMHDKIQRIANKIFSAAMMKTHERQQGLLRQHEKAVKADSGLIDELQRLHKEHFKKKP